MGIGFAEALWLFVLVVTLHMIEEVIWLPAWSVDAGLWHEPVGRRAFAFATAVMLLFLYAISYLAIQAAPGSVSIYLLCGLALVMMVNLFIPHLGATIAQRRYAPGLGTSLFLVVPAAGMLLWAAFSGQSISLPRYAMAAAGVLLGTAVIWPTLLRVGKRLFAQ